MNLNAFWNLSYGVYVVSAWDGKRPTGCIANSVMQITAEPATVAISINHDNFTHECIRKTGKFAISVLSEATDPSIIGVFGFQSGREVNKFDGVPYELQMDMPILKDSCTYVICEVINQMETDTHTVFLGKALDADVLSKDTPMTYSYYHKVIRGKSPKNAPTYIADESEKVEVPQGDKAKEKYVCSICKYEYDGDIPFEELPEDYVCPICRQPKSAFKKQV